MACRLDPAELSALSRGHSTPAPPTAPGACSVTPEVFLPKTFGLNLKKPPDLTLVHKKYGSYSNQ